MRLYGRDYKDLIIAFLSHPHWDNAISAVNSP